MANTYVQQRVHLVWSTLKRQSFLSREYREPLWAFVGGVVRHHRGMLFSAGGIDDHHLYAEYQKTMTLAQFVSVIKSHSSKWLRETYPSLAGFRWQRGYAGFSVARKGDDVLHRYIQNQEEHHSKVTFQQEYVALLRRHEIEFDPRYVFD